MPTAAKAQYSTDDQQAYRSSMDGNSSIPQFIQILPTERHLISGAAASVIFPYEKFMDFSFSHIFTHQPQENTI
ncbi:hypothetical protein [Duganella rhizosphaerae]|uniref:hypothetical protein n=1 Tax=Duganella rhizosphaerae TaxID=2885763 RepID=UPI00403F2A6D